MNDLISRQAAIEAMGCISDSICEQQAIDALCELPTIEAELKWIPVTKRLPETHKEDSIFEDDYKCSDPVIVSLAEPFEGDVVVIATYDEGHDEDLHYGWTDAFYGEELKVVAWMPLPEPYSEVEE